MESTKTVDEIILQYSTRKMDVLQKEYPMQYCKIAVENFLKLKKGVVFLYTGFYVNSHAETDGPVGTYFLAKSLMKLGYNPIIITDEFCENFFKDIKTLYIPLEGYNEDEYAQLLNNYNPICHISIERCGKNFEGIYANMKGADISTYTAPLDELFTFGQKFSPTFAIGDGGNEIGMGNFEKYIKEIFSLSACIIKCDYPIISSVSNWGAYGFIAYLELFCKQEILPTFDEADNYLEYIVSLGSQDGVICENIKSVDGKEWYIERKILSDLKRVIQKKS